MEIMIYQVSNILALSVDSLAAGWLIGPWIRPDQRLQLAVAFGLCDMLGSLIGQVASFPVCALTLTAMAVGAYAIHTAVSGSMPSRQTLLSFLPMVLGFDSLLSPLHGSDVVFLGISSGILAYLACLASSVTFGSYGHRRGRTAVFVMVPCLLMVI